MSQLVMVIDDSLVVRTILETSLQRAGFQASTFPDGLQAMHALTSRAVPVPDLLLLDVGLPKLDGYAVASAFKHQPRLEHTIIIMLSGHDGLFDRLRGRLAGAHAYLSKPFQPATVIATVRSHLNGERLGAGT